MTKYYTNTKGIINLYKRNSIKSEVVTQLIYGESFSIIMKTKKFNKIKIKEDNYQGFIVKSKLTPYIKPTHKIHKIKAKIYKSPSKSKQIYELPFGSKLREIKKNSKFILFNKGWIQKQDVKKISFKEKNTFIKAKIFKNIKYKWGGKTYKGIDCSGLIQILFQFNNKFCPRDAKDQFKYFKKRILFKNIKKNDLIYWKGHVALVLSNRELIHAYGPMKKTVVMSIKKTIERINKTANLKVVGYRRV